MNASLALLRQPAVCNVQCATLLIGSTLLVGTTLHLAKGFGKPQPKDEGSEEQREKKRRKLMRGKPSPCPDCAGKGVKICNFCKGTKKMKGFYDTLVPCIPCESTGYSSFNCRACKGAGFTISK